jgi:FkbM family methyltransferase
LGDSANRVFSIASGRVAAKRAILRSPLAPSARRAGRLLESKATRRDRRDNDALNVLIAGCVAEDACTIDVGANVGRVLAELTRLAPGGRHIAYEPIPALAAELTRRFPMVDVRCKALSDEAGEVEFTHVISRPGYSGFRERTYPGPEQLERIRVPVERLDDALEDGLVPSFIKVDVEGAEGQVFRGAIETLERHRPLVVFEHGKGAASAYGTTPTDVHELLVDRARLRIFDMDGRGPLSADEFSEVFEDGSRWNFFARR